MRLQKNIAIILIPALILTIIWVGTNIYHSHIDSTIDIPLANSIKPIKGSFDLKTVENIKKRTRVNPLNNITPQVSGTPKENPIASRSSNLNLDLENETGTESAENGIN